MTMNGVLTFEGAQGYQLSALSTGLTIGEERGHEHEWRGPDIFNGLVGEAGRQELFRQRIAEIYGYRSLPEDWDTYNGLPARERPVQFAARLLEELRWLPEVLAPYACPISTGVYLEWRSGAAILYFEVDEESVLFVMRKGELVVERGEDADFDVGQAIQLAERFHGITV